MANLLATTLMKAGLHEEHIGDSTGIICRTVYVQEGTRTCESNA